MIVRTITYGRTFNNGDFESTRIELTVDLYDGESFEDSFDQLVNMVEETRDKELNKNKDRGGKKWRKPASEIE